jgi:predicted Zn-dependent protease
VTASSAAVTSVDQERRRAYVAAIVATLVERGGLRRPVIPYTAQVLESPEANAYALPGGWVSITVPLLDLLESEAEVAAVMGHEIAHVDLRHCIERIQYGVVAGKIGGPPFEAMVSVGTGLWSLGYADEQELEADRQGMLYAARAGYHPQAAYRAHERLAKLYGGLPHRADRLDEEIVGMLAGALDDYFATHPPSPERLTHLERAWHEQRLDVEAGTWYLGRENHRLRVARSERELAGEWITGELP